MIKFILMMKICSAIEGSCLPEYNAGVYDSWYDCATIGTINTLSVIHLGSSPPQIYPITFLPSYK